MAWRDSELISAIYWNERDVPPGIQVVQLRQRPLSAGAGTAPAHLAMEDLLRGLENFGGTPSKDITSLFMLLVAVLRERLRGNVVYLVDGNPALVSCTVALAALQLRHAAVRFMPLSSDAATMWVRAIGGTLPLPLSVSDVIALDGVAFRIASFLARSGALEPGDCVAAARRAPTFGWGSICDGGGGSATSTGTRSRSTSPRRQRPRTITWGRTCEDTKCGSELG